MSDLAAEGSPAAHDPEGTCDALAKYRAAQASERVAHVAVLAYAFIGGAWLLNLVAFHFIAGEPINKEIIAPLVTLLGTGFVLVGCIAISLSTRRLHWNEELVSRDFFEIASDLETRSKRARQIVRSRTPASVGRIMDFTGSVDGLLPGVSPDRRDQIALASDWAVLGGDFATVAYRLTDRSHTSHVDR